MSSTWREDATVYEPTGLVAAQVEGPGKVLVHQLDLSHAVLGWSRPLRNGKALTERYGDKVGYHYEPREDLGLFWSNDPGTTIGAMVGRWAWRRSTPRSSGIAGCTTPPAAAVAPP